MRRFIAQIHQQCPLVFIDSAVAQDTLAKPFRFIGVNLLTRQTQACGLTLGLRLLARLPSARWIEAFPNACESYIAIGNA